jgi:hypothetical protein
MELIYVYIVEVQEITRIYENVRYVDNRGKRRKLMEWTQFIIFFVGVFGLFIWNRAEARADARHMDSKLEGQRDLMMAIRSESNASIKAIQEEMKDFHARLVKIEENR